MDETLLRELELAANIILASGPVAVSGDYEKQRQQAENVFIALHKSSTPYNKCKHILETTNNDYVRFQAVYAIRESLMREWSLLEQHDVDSISNFLMNYLYSRNAVLPNYVREQISLTVAVMYKRGAIGETRLLNRQTIYDNLLHSITSGDSDMQNTIFMLLAALLNEFATGSKSSSIGFTWEMHLNCKMQFEKDDLYKICVFCLQSLQSFRQSQCTSISFMARLLSVLELILTWEFIPKNVPRRLIGLFSSLAAVSFKPPASWKDAILNEQFLDCIFWVYGNVQGSSDLGHSAALCICQLASLNGEIFPDELAQKTYLNFLLPHFLKLFKENIISSLEITTLADAISLLLQHFPSRLFASLSPGLCGNFLHQLSQLTSSVCEALSLQHDNVDFEIDYQPALEKLLDAWEVIVNKSRDFGCPEVEQCSVHVFNAYLQCHLSPPNGSRLQQNSEDDVPEVADDFETFSYQLCTVSQVARHVADYSTAVLARLIDSRTSDLCQLLSSRSQLQSLSEKLIEISEDLHWLLLLAGSILTDDADGETPMIPHAVIVSSNRQPPVVASFSIETALNVDNNLHEAMDSILRLIMAVFRLLSVEKKAADAGFADNLSPQVAQTLMWFCKRWLQAYLLPNESHYSEVSNNLQALFGRGTAGGQYMVSLLLEKVVTNIMMWSSEPQVLEQTLNMLVLLLEKPDRCSYATRCSSLWHLAEWFAHRDAAVQILPASSARLFAKALVYCSSSCFDSEEGRNNFSSLVLLSIHERFRRLVSSHELKSNYHNDAVRSEVVSLLETVCGMAEGTRITTVNILFRFLQPALAECINLLDMYHNYAEIVELILEAFKITVVQQVVYLSVSEANELYRVCLNLLHMYAKHNIGRRARLCSGDEEQYNDLLTLMELLTNLMTKDFVDLSLSDSTSPEDSIQVTDVVIYGLDITVPLMTRELLQYPNLATTYFRLITYISESYVEKLCAVSQSLLEAIMETIRMALTSSLGADNCQMAIDCVGCIAHYVYEKQLIDSIAHQQLGLCLQVMFKLLFLESVDVAYVENASNAFHAAICCHQELYNSLVSQLVNAQQESAAQQRLVSCFTTLTPLNTQLMPLNMSSKTTFLENFSNVVANIRAFLCVR